MARVKSQMARKPQGDCGKCGDPITPGTQYRSTRPRYGSKKVRCMKPGCAFRPSDLTSSKMGPLYDAVEDCDDTLAGCGSHEDMDNALQDVASVAREVAEEYREASSQWAGGNGHPEWDEKADEIDGAADEWESASQDLESVWEDALAEADGDEEAALESLREQAQEFLNNVSLP